MTDIVLGAISNYKWDDVAVWINSLNESGFNGRKILVCYNIDENTQQKITGHGIQICHVDEAPDNICVDRFYWYWQLLNLLYDHPNSIVVATDVRDVVFQSNPVQWIKDNVYTPKIIVSSEGIRYNDENWGRDNFKQSYLETTWPLVEHRVILNAGVIAGRMDYFRDLCLQIYWTSRGAKHQHVPGGGGPDQAAYNMIMSSKPWYDSSRLADPVSGWTAQIGTIGDQISYGASGLLTHAQPHINNETGEIHTHDGKKYAIVHQYDRHPLMKAFVEGTYL